MLGNFVSKRQGDVLGILFYCSFQGKTHPRNSQRPTLFSHIGLNITVYKEALYTK